MANSLKFESQKLAINYFVVAAILFGAQLLMGLIAATQFYIQVSYLKSLIFLFKNGAY